MYAGKTVFAQLMALLPLKHFHRCVERYGGDHSVKSFSCLDHFLCMAFAQLTYRESLRDIEACLRAMQPRLYHMGFRCPRISRNTLAHANECRDWRIYADFAQHLVAEARQLYAGESLGFDLAEEAFALDASIVDLSMTLFPWAPHERSRAAVKMHTLLDLRGNIPVFMHVSGVRTSDVSILDSLVLSPGGIYVMDRGYTHMKRLYRFVEHSAFFIIRGKPSMRFQRCSSKPVEKSTGLRCDQVVRFTGTATAADYPIQARRIRYTDPLSGKILLVYTNHFHLPALTVTELYRKRWQIELFFKWIKQHLRIKAFYGTSPNAVKVQLWVALAVYLLIAILRKQLRLGADLHQILQILSLTAFEKTPILQALQHADHILSHDSPANQLILFD